MWIRKYNITVGIFYYMPDYTAIIQEFVWQTEDDVPEFPRVHKFLNFWKDEVEAVIREVRVTYNESNNVTNVEIYRC